MLAACRLAAGGCGGRAELRGTPVPGDVAEASGGSGQGTTGPSSTGVGGGRTATSAGVGGGGTVMSTVTTSSATVSSTSGGGEPPVTTCDPLTPCTGLPPELPRDLEACVGVRYEGEAIPVDLLLVVDGSAQMADAQRPGLPTRWSIVSDAAKALIGQGDLDVRLIGLDVYSSADPESCDPLNYRMPDVPPVSPSTSIDDLLAALDGVQPEGTAMTRAALTGALDFAREWGEVNAIGWTVVILVSGPGLAACESPSDFAELEALAAGASEEQRVSANVIVMDGSFDAEQDECGDALGSLRVFESERGVEALVEELIDVYEHIAPQPVSPCEFQVPPPPADSGQVILFDEVWVSYDSSTVSAEFPLLASAEDCATSGYGGFYYSSFDENGTPTRITLCPCSCAELSADWSTSFEVAFPCAPIRQNP